MKLSEIKTKKDILSRIVDGKLSTGCYWTSISHLFTKDRVNNQQKEITVNYTACPGSHNIVRFL